MVYKLIIVQVSAAYFGTFRILYSFFCMNQHTVKTCSMPFDRTWMKWKPEGFESFLYVSPLPNVYCQIGSPYVLELQNYETFCRHIHNVFQTYTITEVLLFPICHQHLFQFYMATKIFFQATGNHEPNAYIHSL